MWVEADSGSTLDINYAKDCSSYVGSQSVSLEGAGGVWGAAVWGTAVWGGEDALFKRVKLKGSGRFIRFRFKEDDIDESFNIFSYIPVFWDGGVM